jgi:hypothetical protein
MSGKTLTEEQKVTLDTFTNAFREASSKDRKGVLKDALMALFPLVTNDEEGRRNRKKKIKKMRKVELCSPINGMRQIAKVHRWLRLILETMAVDEGKII